MYMEKHCNKNVSTNFLFILTVIVSSMNLEKINGWLRHENMRIVLQHPELSATEGGSVK